MTTRSDNTAKLITGTDAASIKSKLISDFFMMFPDNQSHKEALRSAVPVAGMRQQGTLPVAGKAESQRLAMNSKQIPRQGLFEMGFMCLRTRPEQRGRDV